MVTSTVERALGVGTVSVSMTVVRFCEAFFSVWKNCISVLLFFSVFNLVGAFIEVKLFF